jgi:hypothetical protein
VSPSVLPTHVTNTRPPTAVKGVQVTNPAPARAPAATAPEALARTGVSFRLLLFGSLLFLLGGVALRSLARPSQAHE